MQILSIVIYRPSFFKSFQNTHPRNPVFVLKNKNKSSLELLEIRRSTLTGETLSGNLYGAKERESKRATIVSWGVVGKNRRSN